jgi:hypothetical protein
MRRLIVAGLWLSARAARYRATVVGSAGRFDRAIPSHHWLKCAQSEAYAFLVAAALLARA